MSYCDFCILREENDHHRRYHDHHYGFPVQSDVELFKRLVLEINQAGLSWDTILKKENTFEKAYDGFDFEKIAGYKEKDIDRLMSDSGIIRHRAKIVATIFNASKIIEIRNLSGTFGDWLDLHHPKSPEEWNKLFKKTFKFVGPEIVKEFLMSTGYLKGAHKEDCLIFKRIEALSPKWMEK